VIGDLKNQLDAFYQQQNQLLSDWLHSVGQTEPHDSPMDALNLATKMVTQSEAFARIGATLLERLQNKDGWDAEGLDSIIADFEQLIHHTALDQLKSATQFDSKWQTAFIKLIQQSEQLTQQQPWFQSAKNAWEALLPNLNHINWHSRTTRIVQLTEAYRAAISLYAIEYERITESAIARFKVSISKSESPIESLKSLHDHWVAAYDGAHAEAILSDTYQATYAAVTHAYLDLTEYSQRLMNETFEQFGLCTQSGMTKVFERQHATRKELLSVQKALKEQQVLNDTLAKQLADLEHKVMILATHSIDDQ
jgi:hypothetical protein